MGVFNNSENTSKINYLENFLEITKVDDNNIPEVARVIMAIVTLLTIGVSLPGNLIICMLVYKKKPMRSAINLLLTSIACADLLVVLVMLFALYKFLTHGALNYGACTCFAMLRDVCVSIACYTLLFISMDRYLIIVHRKDRLNPRTAEVIVLVIWIGSLLAGAPQILSFLGDPYDTADRIFCPKNYSVKMNNYKSAYLLLLLTVTFYIPVVIMFYLFAAILRTVQLSANRVQNHSGAALAVSVTQYSSRLGIPPLAIAYRFTGNINSKKKSFGTIMLLFVMIFICWLPYTTCRVMNLDVSTTAYNLTGMVLLTLGFTKSALYPVVFCIRNKKFRATCVKLIPTNIKFPKMCLKRKQRRINPKAVYQCSESETRI